MPAKRAAGKLTVAMLAQAPWVFDRLSVGQRATRHSHTGRLIGFHEVDPGVMGPSTLVCAGTSIPISHILCCMAYALTWSTYHMHSTRTCLR